MTKQNRASGREALADILHDTTGKRLSIVEMHEFMTVLVFEGGLRLKYEGTANYSYQEQSSLIQQSDRVGVFRMLSQEFGQDVTSMIVTDDYSLYLGFGNGFSLRLGNQTEEEVGYEQYQITFDKFIFLFLSDDMDWWTL